MLTSTILSETISRSVPKDDELLLLLAIAPSTASKYPDTQSRVTAIICISKYKNIEVCKYWYDDESRPDTYCWIDVEGIGYGWMWCANKLCSKLRFLQRRAIRKLAMDLLKPEDENTNILCSDNPNEKVRVYGFIPKGNKNVYIQIRLSDEELTF